MEHIPYLLGFILICFLAFKGLTFIYNYDFSSNGIKIVAFGGVIPVAKLRKSKIKNVRIVKTSDLVWNPSSLFALRLGNRWQKNTLVVETHGLFRYWYLTPKDPEEAVRLLALETTNL